MFTIWAWEKNEKKRNRKISPLTPEGGTEEWLFDDFFMVGFLTSPNPSKGGEEKWLFDDFFIIVVF
jgi:hypothetical protein